MRFPVANPDFSAFIQRAKDLNPECIIIFVPGGAQPAALGKAFAERGVDPKKILASGETTAEQALKNMGDAASASSRPGTTTTRARRRATSRS